MTCSRIVMEIFSGAVPTVDLLWGWDDIFLGISQNQLCCLEFLGLICSRLFEFVCLTRLLLIMLFTLDYHFLRGDSAFFCCYHRTIPRSDATNFNFNTCTTTTHSHDHDLNNFRSLYNRNTTSRLSTNFLFLPSLSTSRFRRTSSSNLNFAGARTTTFSAVYTNNNKIASTTNYQPTQCHLLGK